ncbi:MAG: membrane-bound lytic murein transglycosylase MltF [Desulfobacterales bacterium]
MFLINKRAGLLAAVLCIAVLAGSCDFSEKNGIPYRSLEDIKESGRLVVLTRNAPTTYFIDRNDNPAGPEYELAEAFAESIGVKVEYNIKYTVDEILKSLEKGEADIAAAGLTITEKREKRYRFSPSYQEITPQVVTRRDRVQPDSLEEVAGLDIVVIANSSYTERLEKFKAGDYPGLVWTETDDTSTEQLLHDVWLGNIECTVADSNIVDINRRYYPELMAPVNLGRAQQLGWAMAPGNKKLGRAVDRWMEEYRETGKLDSLYDKYYGFFEIFDYVDIRRYIRRIDARFPKYREYFKKAAEKYGLPFDLLAAQGYQESHWNATAVSPTGVRGIMMLTLPTAREMGVSNRLDARQSIFGGARYMARLKRSLADEVDEPDRAWLALAAYNVGLGHLRDAQKLARQQGLDPYSWQELKQVLPLLSKKEYYKDLKYGYARGYEPVRYVQRIREYRHILRNELVSSKGEE